VEGYEVVHAKYESLHLLQCKQKHFEQHCGMQSIPHHVHNNKGGSLLDLELTTNVMSKIES
jgi:hypothetical protein